MDLYNLRYSHACTPWTVLFPCPNLENHQTTLAQIVVLKIHIVTTILRLSTWVHHEIRSEPLLVALCTLPNISANNHCWDDNDPFCSFLQWEALQTVDTMSCICSVLFCSQRHELRDPASGLSDVWFCRVLLLERSSSTEKRPHWLNSDGRPTEWPGL